MDANIGLSVLIAAKDEELSIAEVVKSHFSVLQVIKYPINWDIGVLDDGSSDSTLTVLTELQKQFPELKIWHNDNPSGIANAFKQLAENAQHEWIYITSGDGQFLAEGLEKMIQAWFANPIATLGVRSSRFSSYGLFRSVISFVFRITTRVLFGIDLRDPGSVKIIKKQVALSHTRSTSTMRDAEQLAIASQSFGGLQFVEIPFSQRTTGKSSGVRLGNLISNSLDIFRLIPTARKLTRNSLIHRTHHDKS
jgi:glycosyltransferase involved in cell wall biosynthesis